MKVATDAVLVIFWTWAKMMSMWHWAVFHSITKHATTERILLACT